MESSSRRRLERNFRIVMTVSVFDVRYVSLVLLVSTPPWPDWD